MTAETALASFKFFFVLKTIFTIVAITGVGRAIPLYNGYNRVLKFGFWLSVSLTVIAVLWVTCTGFLLINLSIASQLPSAYFLFIIFASPLTTMAGSSVIHLFSIVEPKLTTEKVTFPKMHIILLRVAQVDKENSLNALSPDLSQALRSMVAETFQNTTLDASGIALTCKWMINKFTHNSTIQQVNIEPFIPLIIDALIDNKEVAQAAKANYKQL